MHTIKVVGYHPYDLKEGPHHWDNIKEHVADETLKYIQRFSPTLTQRQNSGTRSHEPARSGTHEPAQLARQLPRGRLRPRANGQNRPMPGWANYECQFPGLYQTGGTTAPGGSVSGQPGRNAAIVMLKDLGTSLEEVVGKKESKQIVGERIFIANSIFTLRSPGYRGGDLKGITKRIGHCVELRRFICCAVFLCAERQAQQQAASRGSRNQAGSSR